MLACLDSGKMEEKDEEMRLASQVCNILRSLKDAGTATKPKARVELRQPPTPTFGDTALGKVKVAGGNFSMYHIIFSIFFGALVLLPA